MTIEGIRILLVGDFPLLQIGINTLLTDTEENIILVDVLADSNEAPALCETVQPDVVIFNSNLPSVQTIKQLIHERPAVKLW